MGKKVIEETVVSAASTASTAVEQKEKKEKKDKKEKTTEKVEETTSDEAEKKAKKEKKEKKAEKKRQREESTTSDADNSTTTTTTNGHAATSDEQAKKKRKHENESNGTTTTTTTSISPYNFYHPKPIVAQRAQADVDAYYAEHKITVSEPSFRPLLHFSESGLSDDLLTCTRAFEAPTPIQAQAWPVLLSGRDAVAIAETGSGKTLGFVLPGLRHILAQQPPVVSMREAERAGTMQTGAAGPIMLVLSPTRELAMQTRDVCLEASKSVGLRTACIYGGAMKSDQMGELRGGVHTIVATPGRLLSMINDGLISLRRVTFLVLDEADRMLDMGFEPDIRAILNSIEQGAGDKGGKSTRLRQTLMFSATWPDAIQKLAAEFIRSPVHITIGKDLASDLKANTRVKQTVEVLETDRDKETRILSLLRELHASRQNRVLIFALYKKEVDRVERYLNSKGWSCVAISGDKTQQARTQALEDFKKGTAPLLVATDVAARGLDIPNVEHVINYTFPLTVEDYIHRIGRTGRGGKSGNSVTFFTKAEKHLSGELINVLREAGEPVPDALLKFGTAVKKKEHPIYGAHYKANDGQPMKQSVRVTFD